MHSSRPFTGFTALALALTAACGGAKAKAEAAITTADQAVAAVATDAGKVLPYEVQRLNGAVAAARDTLAKGDAAAALAAAEGIPAQAQELAAKVPAKTAELTAQLDTLRFAFQKNLAAIQAKVDEFAKTHRMPPGLDAAKLAKVKETLASAPQEWAAIEAEAKAGNLDSAYGKGSVLRLKVSEALSAVGLVAGETEWHNLKLPPS